MSPIESDPIASDRVRSIESGSTSIGARLDRSRPIDIDRHRSIASDRRRIASRRVGVGVGGAPRIDDDEEDRRRDGGR